MTEIKPGTPLPWSVGTPEGYSASGIYSGEDAVCSVFGVPMNTRVDGVGDSPKWAKGVANARYIVTACNAYPSLLNGLREAREALGHLLKVRERKGVKPQSRDAAEAKARTTLANLDTLLAQEGEG